MSSTGVQNSRTAVRGTIEPTDPEIAGNLCCGPLTDADRERIAEGLEACYRAAGLPWPDHLRWVRSPTELVATVTQTRRLIRRRRRQQWRRTRSADRCRALGWWAAFLGLRMLVVLIAIGLLALVLWRWSVALGQYGGWPAYPPPDVGTILAVGFFASLFALHLLGWSVLWAWRSAAFEVAERRAEPFRLAPTGVGAAADQMLLSSNDFGAAGEIGPSAGERVHRALAPIWHTLWLGPAPRPAAPTRAARPVNGDGLTVRQAVAHTLPARPMVGWLAFRCLTIACEPPVELHVEPVADSYRLHRADGPAVYWADGTRDFYLHGVWVPERLFDPQVSIDDLHREPNSEVRRVLIERLGWPSYVERAGLRLVAVCADPGNVDHRLRLYELPPELRENKRLLMMVNGSPDRSGRRREYAELVPAGFDDPVAAAAWQYDCPVEVYRDLLRRT